MRPEKIRAFRQKIRRWYRRNGRHDLPWRKTRDPYRILVSEIMLQQTQVSRVMVYYEKFLEQFPTAAELACASQSDALAAWSGLGYNRRAKFLRLAAQKSLKEYGENIPWDVRLLNALPGVGHYTAHAVACFSGASCEPFLETNIRRVILHEFFPKKQSVPDSVLLKALHRLQPPTHRRGWYLALMDYGAIGLKHVSNPNRRSRHYAKQSPFEGSLRQVRGQVIRLLLANPEGYTVDQIRKTIEPYASRPLLPDVLSALAKEGMIACGNKLTNNAKCRIVGAR